VLGWVLPHVKVSELTVTADGSTIVAWTHGRGAWSTSRYTPSSSAAAEPPVLSLPPAVVGLSSGPQTAHLTNVGTASLTLTDVQISGDFTRDNDGDSSGNPPCQTGTVLTTYQSCAVNVYFHPTASGARQGTLMFSDGALNSPQRTTLTGQATSQWSSLGGQMGSDADASSWSSNRLDVFVRGTDGALWHRWWSGAAWSAWESLGGAIQGNPAAISWGPGRIDVFARGIDNQLWHKWFNGSWSGWEPLGGVLSSAPDASSWGSGRLDVFARGTDGAIWHKWLNGSWSGWQSLGGTITGDPSAAAWGVNRIDIIGRWASDNSLRHLYWNGSAWQGWENLGGVLTSSPDMTTWGTNRLDMFALGSGGVIYHKAWNGAVWTGWSAVDGTAWKSDPGAVARAAGKIAVFEEGSDNALWHITVTGS
jgi:hypothetical protein